MNGEVVKVEGNTVVVKMSNGELRTFSNVPDSRRARVDGKGVGVRELQPGTKLTATITKTATPVTIRTTTVGAGRVWFVAGNSVILTLPSGENKQYTVQPDYKFIVNGSPATVYDLRPGMVVSAEKIVEEPSVDFATNARVVGQTPGSPYTAPAAAPSAAAPVPGRAAAPAGAAAPTGTAAPARLPKTGSPVPLAGLLGLLFIGGSFAIRRFRR
jgi:LPXTG-motif cell wall-anchored protein